MIIPVLRLRTAGWERSEIDARHALSNLGCDLPWGRAGPDSFYWRDTPAVGERIRLGEDRPWRRIVGVVGATRHWGRGQDPTPTLYLPLEQSMLFGVAPLDPLSLGAAVALVLLTTLVAAWIPARRATRVDPVRSLRNAHFERALESD